MAIDLLSEHVVSLTKATSHLPRRRKGKRPNVSTLFRWAQHGIKGVRLETIQVGGCKCTSLEALQRFCDRLTQGLDPEAQPARSSVRPQRAAVAAERELEREGL